MKTGAIVVSWKSGVPGRESQMLKVLQDVFLYAMGLQQAGRIEEIRFFVSTTGPSQDTFMVFGRMEELAMLLVDDEFEAYIQDGMMVVSDLTVSLWAGGLPEAVMGGIELHARKLQEHGLIPGAQEDQPAREAQPEPAPA